MTKPKRKVECNMKEIEPHNKVLKTTEDDTPNKQKVSLQNMKKSDLLNYCKELEDIISKLQDEKATLIKEKQDNFCSINSLKESIRILELKNKVLEQDQENFKYTCGDCDYESNCVHCFSDHEHDPEDAIEQGTQVANFNCYYCEEVFSSKANVMKHTKLSHVDKANHCLNFLEGTCSYGDRCWFLHDNTLKESDPTFKCNYCESVFKTKTQLMQHKKRNHIEKVSRCSNENQGCRYNSENCWFLHTKTIEKAYESVKNVRIDLNGTCNKNDT